MDRPLSTNYTIHLHTRSSAIHTAHVRDLSTPHLVQEGCLRRCTIVRFKIPSSFCMEGQVSYWVMGALLVLNQRSLQRGFSDLRQ